MATFREFCDGVIAAMPRATSREKRDVRLELTDHLLEHRDMLVDHGVDILEAERRAVEAMGDAGEIGRAWNDKLSPFWLWLGRVCMVAFLVLLLENYHSIFYVVERVQDSLEVRYSEDAGTVFRELSDCELIWSEDPEIREEFGEHIIRIHRAELWKSTGALEEYYLRLGYVTYHQSFLGHSLDMNALYYKQYGDGLEDEGGGGAQTSYASWCTDELKVEKGLETVSVTLDYNGNSFAAEIELDWGGVDG